MAHEYLTCRTCGAVSRSKEDTSIVRLFEQQDCANRHCAGKEFDVAYTKSDVGGATVRALAQRMVAHGRQATHLQGSVTVSYVTKTRGVYEKITHQGRDISAALKRLSTGMGLPADVNGRAHFRDGGKYRGQHLPIQGVKHATTYYHEYGVLSSSRGWEKNLSSERLVTGACGEIYYTSLH